MENFIAFSCNFSRSTQLHSNDSLLIRISGRKDKFVVPSLLKSHGILMQMYSPPPLPRSTLHTISLESGTLDKVIKVSAIHYLDTMAVSLSLYVCIITWPHSNKPSQVSQLPSIKILKQTNKNTPSTLEQINKHLSDIYGAFAEYQTLNTMSWSLSSRAQRSASG